MATPNVSTITQNLAELVAFTRALQWASQNPSARGRPICIRYSSEYSARVGTGAWKAKKHKAMAEEARQAWKQLKLVSRGQAWIRFARADATAAANAARGQRGERVRRETVD